MFKTVIALLGKNSAIWSVIPKLVAAVARFTASVEKIDSFDQSLNGGTKGVTSDKRNARTAMVDSAIEVAGAVFAYASDAGDGELRAKVDFSDSALRDLRDNAVGNTCQAIHDTAEEQLEKLGDCKVDADVLALLQNRITGFNGHLSKPQTKRSNNQAAGKMMDAEFQTADKLLDE